LNKTTGAILSIVLQYISNALKYNKELPFRKNGTNLDKRGLGPCAAQQVERIASV